MAQDIRISLGVLRCPLWCCAGGGDERGLAVVCGAAGQGGPATRPARGLAAAVAGLGGQAFVGRGVQTGAGAVLNSLVPEPGSSIAVFAAGSVGLSAILAAVVAECSPIIAVDPPLQRLDLARELGATHAVDPSKTDPVAAIKEITGTGARYSVDCISLPSVARQALECLRSPGTCTSVGFQGMSNQVMVDQGHLLFGRTLVGVIEGDSVPAEFIPRMIGLYQQGRFPFDKLITTFPFDQINEAIGAAHHGKVVKAMLSYGS